MPAMLWKRGLLAAALGVALCAGLARAQDPETNHPYVLNPDKPHPVMRLLHISLPAGCWASHNGFGCGNLRSDATFVFGSCRAYFGQACLKGPPPVPGMEDEADHLLPGCGCK